MPRFVWAGPDRRRARQSFGGDADRLAERGLQSLGHRTALSARTVGTIVCGTLALPSAPQRWATVAAVAMALIGCGVYWLRVTDQRTRWLVADLVIVCGLCMTIQWTVAPEMLDGGTGWVRNLASITVLAYQWHTRPLTGAAAAVAVAAAYTVGGLLTPEATWAAVLPRGPWMLLEAALARGLWVLVRRGARHADELRRREEKVRVRSAVAAATHTDEREYLAALHDTAAATLLMVGLAVPGGRQIWLSRQARRDVRILTGHTANGAEHVDLVELLGSTLRASPVEIIWAHPGPVRLPPGPATAICRGVHEALVNVAAHAGVQTATVRVDQRADGVQVEVADTGRGFDPDAVSPHKRGVSLSIVERMTAVGGTASVDSRPDAGTRVRLAWSPLNGHGAGAPGTGWRRQARSVAVTVHGFLRGIRLSIFAIVAALLLTWELPMLLAHASEYESLPVQLLAYGVQLLVAAVAGVRVLRKQPLGRLALPLMAAVVCASVAADFGVPAEAGGTSAHWAYGNIGWFGLLLLMESPLWILLAVPGVDYALAVARLVADGQAGFGAITVLTTATVFIWVSQLAVAVSTWSLRRVAEDAAHTALEEERLRTEEAVSSRMHRERQARYAALKTSVVPLLEGLASGELDPADPRVQQSCAVEAARLRRLFAELDEAADPLVHELRACIDTAARRGVTVSLAIRGRGDRPELSRDVRRALTEPALGALMAAATTARVTVVAAPTTATVSVVADGLAEAVIPTTLNRNDRVAVSVMTEDELLWVEATWREQIRSR